MTDPVSTSSFINRVTVELGTVRPNHGVMFRIFLNGHWAGATTQQKDSSEEWFLDIAAPSQFWRNFGPGVAQLAEFLLPLKCWPEMIYHEHDNQTEFSFTLGAKQLSHERMLRELANQEAHGDPPVCLKVFRGRNTEPEFVVVLKCSDVKFVSGVVRDAANRTEFPPGTFAARAGLLATLRKAFRFTAWVAGPLALVGACWGTFASQSFRASFLAALPSWTQFYWHHKKVTTIYDILPVRPLNMLAAFRLGNIYEQVKTGRNVAELLKEAGDLVQRDNAGPLTLEQLQALPKTLADMMAEVGPVQKALGLINFVNLVWLFAILVIAVSLGPAIYFTIRPLSALIRRISYWLWRNIIKPAAIWCHEWSVFEVLAWAATLITLADSHRVPASVQLYIQTSAVVFAVFSSGYSTMLHGLTFLKPLSDKTRAQLAHLYGTAFLVPLALTSRSQLLGFATLANIYGLLGYVVQVGPLCWMIGFENEEKLLRVATCSALILSGYWLAVPRLLQQNSSMAELVHTTFGPAVGVFGSVALHTALLIFSADPVHMFSLSYLKRNSITIGALLATSLAGHLFLPSSGMATTATVFASLYASQKYAELHTRNKWNGWLLALVSGLVLYRGAIAVHTNPDLLLSFVSA